MATNVFVLYSDFISNSDAWFVVCTMYSIFQSRDITLALPWEMGDGGGASGAALGIGFSLFSFCLFKLCAFLGVGFSCFHMSLVLSISVRSICRRRAKAASKPDLRAGTADK